MPYPRRHPVSEMEMESSYNDEFIGNGELTDKADMNKKRYEGHHSVCQTLRDIYHMTDDKDIRLKCRLAMAMTKAMNEKLKAYKAKEESNGNRS